MAPTISGTTQLAAVIGSPARHSLSPALFNAAFAAIGFDARYVAFEVASGSARSAVEAMRHLGLLGLNVTTPHKDAVLAACDRVSDAAAALGAANCLSWVDGEIGGEILADSTDGEGWRRGLAEARGADVDGLRAGVVGAGGAARAVVRSLADAGATEIVIVNRSPERAQAALAVAGANGRVGAPDDLGGVDLVINATTVGMGDTPHAGEMPFDVAGLKAGTFVSDLIYHPFETPLLRAAAERGLPHQNGLSMLIHQAAVAFERWTGTTAPVQVMRAGAQAALGSR